MFVQAINKHSAYLYNVHIHRQYFFENLCPRSQQKLDHLISSFGRIDLIKILLNEQFNFQNVGIDFEKKINQGDNLALR